MVTEDSLQEKRSNRFTQPANVQFREALRIVQENSSRDLPPFRVLLACGFNPLHLQTLLCAHSQLRMPGRHVLLSTGLYGDLWGTLSRIGNSPLDACAIALEWADLDPRLGFRQLGGWGPKDLKDIVSGVESKLSGLRETLLRTPHHLPVALSCPTLPLPRVFHTPACQFSGAELRLQRAVDDLHCGQADGPPPRQSCWLSPKSRHPV
jgi:hypothetical protein